MTKEEIIDKANKILADKAYLKLCEDAAICPHCGTELKLERHSMCQWNYAVCTMCGHRKKWNYNRDTDNY